MTTNRMFLVCTECGEALELASYEPPQPGSSGRWWWHPPAEPVGQWMNRHAHGVGRLFGPTCFRLAFEAEQEGGGA